MILIEVPFNHKEFVKGKWDMYAIEPRLMNNGNGAINPNVLKDIPKLPDEIRVILESCKQREFTEDDFPPEGGDK